MIITDEFREKVDKAARSVSGASAGFDWEDISQSMWVWFLENPVQYERYLELGDPFQYLKKVAKQEVYKANNAWEWYSGQYTYTPGEVRGLLNEYLFDVTIEAIAEHTDLVEGLLMLKTDAPSYFKAVIDKWVHGEEKNGGFTTQSVNKLTVLMNQVNQAARYSYEGPGSRKVLTNAQSAAKKDATL